MTRRSQPSLLWLLLAACLVAVGPGAVANAQEAPSETPPAAAEAAEATDAPPAADEPADPAPAETDAAQSDSAEAEPAETDTPAADETPADETPADETPADETPADEGPADEGPAEESTPEEAAADESADDAEAMAEEASSEEASEESSTAELEIPAIDPGAGDAGAADANAAGEGEGEATGSGFLIAGAILGSLVLAIVVGNWLGNRLGMPDHAWKIATILTTLVAAGISLGLGERKLGVDLAGGTTLIYELKDPERLLEGEDADDPEAARGENKVTPEEMCAAIRKRVDPAGQKEVSIRPYGKNIEVIVPKASGADLEFIKSQITNLGQLEFHITADRGWRQDADLIERALEAPVSQKSVLIGGGEVARWVPFVEKEFAGDPRMVFRQTQGRPEVLVLIEPDSQKVNGGDLLAQQTRKDFDNSGRPVVDFAFKTKGAKRFRRLTEENLPSPSNPNLKRRLGIMLSNELISAPNINEVISGAGQISGSTMTEEEVDGIVSVLRAGSLPAELNKTPLSVDVVSPTLGKLTVQQAARAITASLIAVLVFMALYYRYAGIVACLALVANLLLVVGLMVMMDAAFTLPGMAGLVLTVGMSVDANVLIFERIREELDRGAALRMAIRNGFGRATTTIVDANVTTLIAAVVLWNVGTDAIKGFAVTLFLGVLMSMYTAIFCSRVVFDIAERRRWIKQLKFGKIVGKTSIDFIGKRGLAAGLSAAVIVLGLIGVFNRGSDILNIDFTGGTSVTLALKPSDPLPFKEVQDRLFETELKDKDLLVVQQGESQTRYKINSNLAAGQKADDESAIEEGDIVGATQDIIAGAFDGMLLTNKVDFADPEDFAEGESTGSTVALTFNDGEGYDEGDGLAHDALLARIEGILSDLEINTSPTLESPLYQQGSGQPLKEWTLRLGNVSTDNAAAVAGKLKEQLEAEPIFPLASRIGGKVAGNLQAVAINAIVFSLLGIVAYIWFRFQNVSFGLAAVVALVHDVLVTLGAIALSAYLYSGAQGFAELLQIEAFQIGLPTLAAFLTIIGYSLNDTIVVFDRIREVRGKSPRLTGEMINTSINQTLSRTLLTSLTTLIVVGILYFFGGPGIHGFAFALVVGVIVGTYSSIFIASPVLLALVGRDEAAEAKAVDVSKKTPGAAAV
ncbi:MAG: protein translocase subunit SecD [Planctomycetota bacterium]